MDEIDYKCPGCGRNELHKRCPAHGTPFYISGVDFTQDIEDIIYTLKTIYKIEDAEKIVFCILKLKELLEKK